ncbi:MAG: carbohydrate porin [Planctomycetaceae bacterium]
MSKLKEQVAALSAQQSTLLEQEVVQYLDRSQTWRGAEGAAKTAWDMVTLNFNFTAVVQGTAGLDPADRTGVSGDVDLNFWFTITDNLDGFLSLTANSSGDFEGLFGSTGSFPAIGGRTGSGLTDLIGVNGAAPTDPGAITVYEAGIVHRWMVGETWLNWSIFVGDPRTRFSQNAFADDENTQFLNNLFDDSPSVPWMTDASGRGVFGMHMWVDLGADKNWRVSWAWFNAPGQFFDNGQFFIQLAWKGEVNGRAMNVRVFGFIDAFFEKSATGDDAAGGGVSWDWWVSDKIGLFVRINANGSDANPVELDASFGAVFSNIIGSRPDDQIGVAIGIISLQNTSSSFNGVGPFVFLEDTELTFEVYYKAVFEGGKLNVTGGLQVITDPGGGFGWADDTLLLLHFRVFVPF